MYGKSSFNHNEFADVEPPRKPLSLIQSIAVCLIPATAATAWALIYGWSSSDDTSAKFLGGLNWDDKVKQWHYVGMTAFFFFASVGMSAYRLLPIGKLRNKMLHGVWHTFGIISFSVGLAAMLKSHNDNYMPNLWSLHSWVGVMCFALYAQNYVLGFLAFGLNVFGDSFKPWYLEYHRALGDVAYILLIAAMESGITEQNAFIDCYAAIDLNGEKDYNPANHYLQLYLGCRLSNGAGVLVVITALLVFIVSKNFATVGRSSPSDPLLK